MSDEFDDLLAEVLPDFDAELAEQGIGLTQRPFRASCLFVKHCILEVKGDTKDNYWSKAWFGSLFRSVNAWYEKRYGNALQQRKPSKISTVVSAFATPFRAEVPLVVNEPALPDKTFWLSFPIAVPPSEDHMVWLVNPPNFDTSTTAERSALSYALIESATHLRATHVNLMTADHEDELTRSLAQGILPHLEKGALDIARSEPNSRSIAVWELNFACEKAIKTFLRQQRVDPPRTHDIRHLHQVAIDRFGPNEMNSAVAVFPTEKVVVRHRYAEIPPPSLTEALSIYRAALSIADGYSHKLARTYTFDNAKFHLKMPPWLDQA